MHLGQENVGRHFRSSPEANLKNENFQLFVLIYFFKLDDSDPFTDSEYVICFKIDQGILEKLSVKVLKRESE